MRAYSLTAPNFSRTVIAEGRKSCPVFEKDDITHDRGASYAFDKEGKLLLVIGGDIFIFREATVSPEKMPDWGREFAKKNGGEAIEDVAEEETPEPEAGVQTENDQNDQPATESEAVAASAE